MPAGGSAERDAAGESPYAGNRCCVFGVGILARRLFAEETERSTFSDFFSVVLAGVAGLFFVLDWLPNSPKGKTLKALTLWQPWASLIALGEKQIETRCWQTSYRGPLAIHAAAKLPPRWLGASMHEVEFRYELADVLNVRRDNLDAAIHALPYGKVVAIVNLRSIEETRASREILCHREHVFGNYEDGRYAWFLELRERIDPPIPAKGNRLLWNWDR